MSEPTKEESAEPKPEAPGDSAKPTKNPKRVEAGKKAAEAAKKNKERILKEVADANANADKAKNEVVALKKQMEQQNEAVTPEPRKWGWEYQAPIIIVAAGLYLWFKSGGIPHFRVPNMKQEPTPSPVVNKSFDYNF